VEKHAVDIENLALDLLSRPETPVIPLKLFIATFKGQLKTQQLPLNTLEIVGADHELSIDEHLHNIVLKLQK